MLALMPLLLSTLALADDPAPVDHVTLAFGWRPGMKAKVTASEVRDNGGGTVLTSTGTSTLEVRDSGDGALNLVWSHVKQTEGSQDPTMALILSEFHGHWPAERVDATGAWQGLVDPESVEATLNRVGDAVEATMPAAPVGDPKAAAAVDLQRTVFRSTLSLPVVSGRTEKVWNDEVAFWIGGELELGRLYEFDADQVTAQGAPLKAHVTFQAVERVPCTNRKGAPECVRLTLHNESDPDTTRALTLQVMRPALERMGLSADALTEARDESTLTLLVEPASLRPWHSVSEQRTTVTIDAKEPGGPQHQTRLLTRTKSWSWR